MTIARGVALLAALAAASPAVADDDPVELDPLEVRPLEDPLWADRERLRKLIDDQPCLGCDAAVRKSLGEAFAEYLVSKATPPNPSLEERREDRLANEWRVSERGPEMDGFR